MIAKCFVYHLNVFTLSQCIHTHQVCDDEEEVCGDNEAGRSSTEEHEGEDVLGVISLVNLTQHKVSCVFNV